MAFGQGVVFTGGYWSCPVVQCGATVTTALTAPTSLFVALIRTYTPMHSDFLVVRFVFVLTLLHSPAVGKVGKPRWGHPLVEFVIVGKICRFAKDSSSTRACSCIHTRIKG